MSYLSLLFASDACVSLSGAPGAIPGGEARAFVSAAGPLGADATGYAEAAQGPSEEALPSGVASMEHWLDLNA